MRIIPNYNTLKEIQDEIVLKDKVEMAKNNDEDEKLMEVCKDFESIFVYMVMKEMKNTVPDGELTEKSTGREIFEEMYIEELSKEIVEKDEGFGIARMMYEQYKKGYVNW